MRARGISAWLLLVLPSLFVASAAQSDTTKYTYDPLGRLTQVSTTAGTGTTSTYTYDPADNRSNVSVVTGPGTCTGVSFTVASNAAVTEGANSIFTVTKAGAAATNCSVTYATSGGSATSGADYTAGSGTLTFTPTQTSQTVSIPTIDDVVSESAETFTMLLSSPSGGATLGTQFSVVGTINDNDAAATCSGANFTIGTPAPIVEGGSVTFTVTKSGSTPINCSVDYTTSNGTAMSPGDYIPTSGTLTYTPTQTSRTFTVSTTDDAAIESTETINAVLSNPTAGATLGSPSSAIANVTDSDSAPNCAGVNFTISSNGPLAEGATATITITKNGTATGLCSLNYKTVDGSATRDDYSGTAGSFAFSQAQITQTFTVPTTNDTIPEANESFTAMLAYPNNSAILGNPSSVDVTIVDNDGGGGSGCSGVSFSIAPAAAVTEGGFNVFTVTKSGSTAASCSVNYTTLDGTAALPSDYMYATGTVTFTAAQTSKTFSITTWDDSLAESAETYSVALSSPSSGATLGSPSSASATINDNDSVPVCNGVSYSIGSPVAVTEGGTTVFTVTKSGTATGSCGVNYATANGTAAAGSDYTGATGTLTFLTGDTSKTFSVPTTDDATAESAETFSAILSSPSGGSTLGTPSSANATINDNDSAGVCSGVSFAIGTPAAVTEGGSSVFTITKSGTATGTCGISYATTNGTAAAGSDYTAASGTLTYLAGDLSKTFSVTTIDDAAVESTETFSASLSAPSGGAMLGSPSGATAAINDNDTGGGTGCNGVSFRVNDYAGDEGGTFLFTVTKTGSASVSCSVSYTTANGTAVTPNDYGATSGMLTFAPNETSKTVAVTTVIAGPGEADEYFYMNLSGAGGGATITDGQGLGTLFNYVDGGGCPLC